ncbi:putative uncharacterized protein DDB_G0282133 [Plodia interpunctella]|uniref:putative uncharacterized protein DDB_G0282133 n=1 Tax=Plodia interpunctella TaxID=58824 RepID=UPI0023681EB6|nr:putative uncharacterized protein DDB_G0282133 [Plodia interpunctella]
MNIGIKYSFKKMKLVFTVFTILIINYPVNADSNEEFIFPPKFQTPGTFVSESSLYLPPESHTPIPYFPIKKFANLPFPYLPPTSTKSPIPFPSPFPIILSTNGVQHYNDDEDYKHHNERENKTPVSTPRPPFAYNRNNRTENIQEQQMVHKRDMRQIQKPMQYQQPIDRVDVRMPHQFSSEFSTASSMIQKPTARSMIISSETHRNDNIFDQLKSGSSQGGHFVVPPGGFISSTTEPAIPILRLSNEMDLDGSFSYEALGADQTHYVQHSHMENQGTEKEEQVVEGSYSYVGDNGQTYTVHYIADSNGFRASGDHLPVAPPIPEIIQRAIQYNLAEEAKKPPHLKSWQSDEQEREHNDIFDKRFAIPPPRNLFTGRTPEAFSNDLSQRLNMQNNLEAAASSQIPVKTVDFVNKQQGNINTGTIAPQITFLASQGAHVPSANTQQQTVSRMFSNDKPSLPQIVNYEADDNNKALWRWQYGLNSNSQTNNNQASEKNSISRSSGDDVVINFNEMTPEQYTKMLHNEISSGSTNILDNSARHFDNSPVPVNQNSYTQEKINQNEKIKYNQNNNLHINAPSVNTIKSQEYSEDFYKNYINNNYVNSPNIQQTFQQDNLVRNPETNSVQDLQSLSTSQQNYINNNHFNGQNVQQTLKQDNSVHNPAINSVQDPQPTSPSQQIHQEEKSNNYNENTPNFEKTYTYQQTTIHPISQTEMNPIKFVTQINNFDDLISYEPRRIKSLNQYTTVKSSITNKNYVTYDDYSKMNTPGYSTQSLLDIEKGSTLLITEAPTTTAGSIKFADFISLDTKDNFRPIIKSTNEQKQIDSSETSDSDLTNNIFLKNILKPKADEPEELNKAKENSEKQMHKKVLTAETKSDKIAKYINLQSKPFNDIKINKKKPVDISEIINYITMKNHFESSKVSRPKNKPQSFDNTKQRNEMHYIDDEDHDAYDKYSQGKSKQINIAAPYEYPQLGELRGNIKNYKVLQRNNNLSNFNSNQLKRELVPPPVKTLQTQNLPPLGRAGPSTKSYLPPIYI